MTTKQIEVRKSDFGALRTPEERFENLPDFPFAPHYAELTNPRGDETLRMHYVDEGPPDACVVLMIHGEPTWSYLYRKMIPVFLKDGFRVVAPDHIGFGRSDKLADKTHYSFAQHVAWAHELVCFLDLSSIILICQGWGGPIGMGVVAREVDRFSRVVAGNTMLHTCEPELTGCMHFPNHAEGEQDQRIATGLLEWIVFSQRTPDFQASKALAGATARDVPTDVLAAYDAPFPDERFKQGMRQFPALIPVTRNDPGAAINRHTFEVLSHFERPFLTIFGDSDATTKGCERIFQDRIPGAEGQPHSTLERAGHFWQEDCGEEAAHLLVDWLRNRKNMKQIRDPSSRENNRSIIPTSIKSSIFALTHRRTVARRRAERWMGMDDTALTWKEIGDCQDIRLYAGDIPFFRQKIRRFKYLREQYDKLVGLSINKSDAHHILHNVGESIPLRDNSVSFYQSEDVFNFLPFESLRGVLDEIHRVLRPDALFRWSFPDYGCDVLRNRCLYNVNGDIVFDPGAGGTPQSSYLWFGRIDKIKAMIDSTKFNTDGTVEYLHYYKMDDTPVTQTIDYSKGHIGRTPDFDRRVKKPYRPMSMVIDLTKGGTRKNR